MREHIWYRISADRHAQSRLLLSAMRLQAVNLRLLKSCISLTFFRSLQAELWVNPGPRGGVDPRQRARAQMPVSLVYWEDAATGTSARSGQGRERIEEDARVRAYAAYGLDGAE